jgi:hypothetical protein
MKLFISWVLAALFSLSTPQLASAAPTLFCKTSPESGALIEIDIKNMVIISTNAQDTREQKLIPITSFTDLEVISDIPGEAEEYGRMNRILRFDLNTKTLHTRVMLPNSDEPLIKREVQCVDITE